MCATPRSYEPVITATNVFIGFPAVSAVLYLILNAVSEYSNLARTLTNVSHLANSNAAHHAGLGFYLKLDSSDHIDFWLLLRQQAKDSVDDSVKAFVGPALLVNLVLVAVLVWRLLRTSITFGVLDVICLWDFATLSGMLVAFIMSVVNVNYQSQKVHLEV